MAGGLRRGLGRDPETRYRETDSMAIVRLLRLSPPDTVNFA
jgi:hypothetical protein